jgi:hypothetical protein
MTFLKILLAAALVVTVPPLFAAACLSLIAAIEMLAGRRTPDVSADVTPSQAAGNRR